jgi:hypothetical protein
VEHRPLERKTYTQVKNETFDIHASLLQAGTITANAWPGMLTCVDSDLAHHIYSSIVICIGGNDTPCTFLPCVAENRNVQRKKVKAYAPTLKATLPLHVTGVYTPWDWNVNQSSLKLKYESVE